MDLIRIKRGNSFTIVCTLDDTDPNDITGLRVLLAHKTRGCVEVDYTIADGAISIHVGASNAPYTGVYRVVIHGVLAGETVDRNPYAFELVDNVEDENLTGSCPSVVTDPVPVNVSVAMKSGISWGGIRGNIEDQTDLIDRLNEIEDNAAADVIQEINKLGFQTGAQVAATVGQKITEHNNDVDAHEAALVPYAKKTDIPSMDGYATEQYVDSEISRLESTALTFKGFISPDEPAGDVRDGNYWYAGNGLPANFPLSVQVYDAIAGGWGNPIEYTPSAFDVWGLSGDSYYYFGSAWERLDFGGSTFNPDHFVVINGVVSLANTYASLPAIIGNINTILDAINGEII